MLIPGRSCERELDEISEGSAGDGGRGGTSRHGREQSGATEDQVREEFIGRSLRVYHGGLKKHNTLVKSNVTRGWGQT